MQKILQTAILLLVFFNLNEEKAMARFNLDEVSLPESTGKTLSMTDIWTGKSANTVNANVMWELEPYDCAVFRAKVVDLP